MSETVTRPIRKFNPGTFQSDEEVIDQFVVRQHQLDRVLEVVRGNMDSPSCQHVLIVAARGRGKTMLLARVAAELRGDRELSEHLLPVRFMEESPEIFDMADFWLETLFHLAREIAGKDPQLTQELRASHTALTARWRDEAIEESARAVVLSAADRLDKKLVLIVENLQSLVENADKDLGWKLRAVLQSEPQVMLLASSTSRFEVLDDAGQPFFELFRTVDLEPLNAAECARLWTVVSGERISGREIRPLQILTGGSPRLLVIVAGFSRHRSLRKLMEELVELIDEHTEYFRGHLEALGKTERRVYIAVIDLWQLSWPGEIAARARMDIRIVSTMLGRLVKRGAVLVEGHGRKRQYAATERLYSIYYKLRRERDEAAVVRNLIHFMTVFYSDAELAGMSSGLIAEATGSPAIREGIQRAADELPRLRDVCPEITRPGESEPPGGTSPSEWGRAGRFLREITEAVEARAFERVVEIADQAFAPGSADWSVVPDLNKAQALCARASAHRYLDNCEAAVGAFDDVIATYGATRLPALQRIVAQAILDRGNSRFLLGDQDASRAAHEEVIERYSSSEAAELQPVVAEALFGAGVELAAKGDSEKAIAALDEVVERYLDSEDPEIQQTVAFALLTRGGQRGERGDFEAEIADCDMLIDRFGGLQAAKFPTLVIMAMEHKSIRLAAVGRAEEALITCDEVEARVEALDEVLRLVLGWRTRRVRTVSHLMQGNLAAAVDTFRSAYAAYRRGNLSAMPWILEIAVDLGGAGLPAPAILEIMAGDKAKSDEFAPLVVALRQLGGEEVRASPEVLEVAADVRQRIESRFASNPPADSQLPSTAGISPQ